MQPIYRIFRRGYVCAACAIGQILSAMWLLELHPDAPLCDRLGVHPKTQSRINLSSSPFRPNATHELNWAFKPVMYSLNLRLLLIVHIIIMIMFYDYMTLSRLIGDQSVSKNNRIGSPVDCVMAFSYARIMWES